MALPIEIHGEIAQYLTDADLCNYRQVCKSWADIGAKELFRVLRFNVCSISVGRLQNFAKHKHLKACIKTLVWDSVLWDKGTYTEEQWKAYFARGDHDKVLWERLHRRTRKKHPLPKDEDERKEWLALQKPIYDELRRDEKAVLEGTLHPDNIAGFMAQFPALQSVWIYNGTFKVKDREVRKIRGYIDIYVPSFLRRGDNMFDPTLEDGPQGVHALIRTIDGLSAKRFPWELQVDALDFAFFNTPYASPSWLGNKLDKLTSLTLALSYLRDGPNGPIPWRPYEKPVPFNQCKAVLKVGALKNFLLRMKSLRSLSLIFKGRTTGPPYDSVADLSDILPLDEDWTSLKSLSLANIDTSEDAMISLLRRHAPTLRTLHLEELITVPNGSWKRIFEAVQPVLQLRSVSFGAHYLYGSPREELGDLTWWVTGSLREELERYLLSGGECPLNEENTVWKGLRGHTHDWALRDGSWQGPVRSEV